MRKNAVDTEMQYQDREKRFNRDNSQKEELKN